MAFPNDSSRIARALTNLESSTTDYTSTVPSGPAKGAHSLIRKTYNVEVPFVFANGTGNAAGFGFALVANASPSIRCAKPVRVLGVNMVTRTAVTSDYNSYATIAVRQFTALGAITVANICSNTTKTAASGGTGDLAVGRQFSFVVDTAADRVAANSWIGIHISQTSNGVYLGNTTFSIDVEEEGPDGYAV